MRDCVAVVLGFLLWMFVVGTGIMSADKFIALAIIVGLFVMMFIIIGDKAHEWSS